MNKDEFYAERILWRANKNKLLEKRCELFSETIEENKKYIIDTVKIDINPILVFWDNPERWTILGSKAISSYYNGKLNTVELDEIQKKIVIKDPGDSITNDIKTDANLLYLERTESNIWVPQGAELFALMNILLMFPLSFTGAD